MEEAELSVDNMELELDTVNVQGGMMHHLSTQQVRKRKDPPEQKEQDESSNTHAKEHHLVAFLCGIVCTKCNTGVGSSLWSSTRKVIKGHFTTHKCYSGLGTPKYTQIANDLTTAQKALHESAKSNHSLALDLISKTFPPNLVTKSIPVAHYCQNCGHWDTKSSGMDIHFNQFNGSRNKYKCHHHLHHSKGVICKGLFDLHCPEEILKSIGNGTFKLPVPTSDKSKTPNLRMSSALKETLFSGLMSELLCGRA